MIGRTTAHLCKVNRRADLCAKRPTVFRVPTREDQAYYDRSGPCPARHLNLPIGAYFDTVEGLADVDGRIWVMGENIWCGFPDPPPYAFFALDADGAVWAGRNFDAWPQQWRLEPQPA